MLNQKRRKIEDTICLLVFHEFNSPRLSRRERRLVRALISQRTEVGFYLVTETSVSIDFAVRRLLGRREPNFLGPPAPHEVEANVNCGHDVLA